MKIADLSYCIKINVNDNDNNNNNENKTWVK